MKIIKRIMIIAIAIFLGIIYSYGNWSRAIYNTDVGTASYENTGGLKAGTVLQQEFICVDNGMCGLKIKLTKQENQSIGDYKWSLKTASGETIAQGVIDESTTENKEFDSSSAQKRGNIELEVPRQKNCKGKKYVLSIQSKDVSEEQTMAVYMTEKGDGDTTLLMDGSELNKVAVIKIEYEYFNIETFVVFLGITLYLYGFVRFMYRLFK